MITLNPLSTSIEALDTSQVLSVLRLGCSVSACSILGIPSHTYTGIRARAGPTRTIDPYPNRPIKRPSINSDVPPSVLGDWATSVGLVLGPLITTEAERYKVLCLLYHYKHLNGTNLTDVPCTDLITHRVRIKPGTRPASNKT